MEVSEEYKMMGKRKRVTIERLIMVLVLVVVDESSDLLIGTMDL